MCQHEAQCSDSGVLCALNCRHLLVVFTFQVTLTLQHGALSTTSEHQQTVVVTSRVALLNCLYVNKWSDLRIFIFE